MKTECTPVQLEFQGVGRRSVRGAFDGGYITSEGGAMLLREVDARLGITDQLAPCFTDHRHPDFVEHSALKLVRQRVYGLALGYEDLNDHDDLKRDPLLALAAGKTAKGSNPRFIVTNLPEDFAEPNTLYDTHYCARGDMENRIKEQQLDLFAGRTSTHTLRANQLRLWFSSAAYVLMNALRRIGLKNTEMAKATCATIRLKLLKLGAQIKLSVRRILIHFASACPYQDLFIRVWQQLQHYPLRT